MKNLLTAFAILSVAACGEEAPKPPAQPIPLPATPLPAPAPAPEAKAAAPEAPKRDANQELAARVKQALEDDNSIEGGGIDVTASEGKVTLWGTTATDGERKQAAGIATKVDGVKAVDNQIKVVRGS